MFADMNDIDGWLENERFRELKIEFDQYKQTHKFTKGDMIALLEFAACFDECSEPPSYAEIFEMWKERNNK